MFPQTFQLLQNEGALMQGCFKSSLGSLRAGENAERGRFYSAFFNFGIGLERLLKVILLLDAWHRERKFPDNNRLREFGHKVDKLYGEAKGLFSKYGLEWKTEYDPDEINTTLLNFISDFSNGSRYFNLDTLAGQSKSTDPVRRWEALLYDIYNRDVPECKRSSGREPPGTSPQLEVYKDPEECETTAELAAHHVIVVMALPHLCWRLVQLLIPLHILLIAVREEAQKDDFSKGGPDADPSVPFMEEFLDFVCEDKSVILESKDWP